MPVLGKAQSVTDHVHLLPRFPDLYRALYTLPNKYATGKCIPLECTCFHNGNSPELIEIMHSRHSVQGRIFIVIHRS